MCFCEKQHWERLCVFRNCQVSAQPPTPRKFSADCELKGRKTKEGKAGAWGGGVFCSCKLSTQMEETSDLAFSHNGGRAH